MGLEFGGRSTGLRDRHRDDRYVDVRHTRDSKPAETDETRYHQHGEQNERRDRIADRPGGDVQAHLSGPIVPQGNGWTNSRPSRRDGFGDRLGPDRGRCGRRLVGGYGTHAVTIAQEAASTHDDGLALCKTFANFDMDIIFEAGADLARPNYPGRYDEDADIPGAAIENRLLRNSHAIPTIYLYGAPNEGTDTKTRVGIESDADFAEP